MSGALCVVDAWDVPLHAVAVVGPDGAVGHGDTAAVTRIASVSKPLFAYACLIAVEEGLFGLDDPAGPLGSTVRHLLAHASGLPFEVGQSGRSVPGVRRIYSNEGFDLLGRLLEDRAAMPCGEYLDAAVFAPLGMRSSTLRGSVAKDVWSSVDDLVRFTAELLSPSLVDPSTLADATSVQFPELAGVLPDFGTQRPCPWGLGFEIRGHKAPHWTGRRNSPATFGHFGATGSMLWVDPAVGRGLVCLTDRQFGAWAHDAFPALSDAVLAAIALDGT